MLCVFYLIFFLVMYCVVKYGVVGLEDIFVSCGKNCFYYFMFDVLGEDLGEEDYGDDCS